MEVRIYTDDDAVMFGNLLDKEKVCYTKETTTEDDTRPVMIFRCVGDVKDLIEIQRMESPCARTYHFGIEFLDDEGHLIEKDSFVAQVMDTCNDDENREAADDLVEAYCNGQMIHYEGVEDWDTTLTDAG